MKLKLPHVSVVVKNTTVTHNTPSLGDIVAVYGTLKKGYENHHVLADAELVSHGETCEKLRLHIGDYPYLFEGEHNDGHQIRVEIYKPLTAETWQDLDELEDHPNLYERKLTNIQLSNGETIQAWVYYAKHQCPQNATFIANF